MKKQIFGKLLLILLTFSFWIMSTKPIKAAECCIIAGWWYQNGQWVLICGSHAGTATCCGSFPQCGDDQ